MRKTIIFSITLIILLFVIGVLMYGRMPEKIASHWDFNGEANGYMHKTLGLFLLPIIILGIYLLMVLIPKLDPLKKNLKEFEEHYFRFAFFIVMFMSYLYVLTILWNLGYQYNMNLMFIPAIGTLFIYLGTLLSKVKRNWFIGIRTPWTMSSDKVWEKTHRLGSKLFMISGIISFIGVLFNNISWLFVLTPVVITTLWLIVYSYLEYKKLKRT